MGKIYDWLAAPGKKGPIADAAPTQVVARLPGNDYGLGKIVVAEVTTIDTKGSDSVHNVTGYVDKQKDERLDRWLDWVVWASGSEPVFLFIVAGLLVWALVGIKYGQTDSWAVMISDIQAILSYLLDSLLVRQQLNGYDKMIRLTASLPSRNASHQRMLRSVQASGKGLAKGDADADAELERRFQERVAEAALPQENWLGKFSTRASDIWDIFLPYVSTGWEYSSGLALVTTITGVTAGSCTSTRRRRLSWCSSLHFWPTFASAMPSLPTAG